MQAVEFFKDDQKLISGSINCRVIIANRDGSSTEVFKTIRVGDLKVVEESNRLYILENAGKRIVCYDLNRVREIFRIEERDSIFSFDFTLDERYLIINTSFEYPQIKLFNIEKGSPIKSPKLINIYTGHVQSRFYIKTSFGGSEQSLVSSGSEDSKIYIWNRYNRTLLRTLVGHTATVNCIAWSPTNPEILVSGSDDYTVKVWSTKECKVNVEVDQDVSLESEDYEGFEDTEPMNDLSDSY